MKTKKSLTITTLSAVAMLAILSPSAFAASSQSLNLTAAGMIVSAGNQHYAIKGGQLVSGEFGGNPIAAGRASFSLGADVVGLTTTGSASFAVPSGKPQLSVSVAIYDEVPGQVFPLVPVPGVSPSEVPFFFIGLASVSVQGGSAMSIPVVIESAYWNPFGGPIIIASADILTNPPTTPPALLLLVTYNVATIDWTGVQLGGSVSGTFGPESVSGTYGSVTNSHENLFAGVEQDSGQIFFTGMSEPALDAAGPLHGSTSFNLAGAQDCSSITGIPGTCIFTGASSLGSFQMSGATGLKIHGTFSTMWSVPSITTTTTVAATVTQ